MCLSSDYSLVTFLNIFVYEIAESAHISLPFQSIVHMYIIHSIHISWLFTVYKKDFYNPSTWTLVLSSLVILYNFRSINNFISGYTTISNVRFIHFHSVLYIQINYILSPFKHEHWDLTYYKFFYWILYIIWPRSF